MADAKTRTGPAGFAAMAIAGAGVLVMESMDLPKEHQLMARLGYAGAVVCVFVALYFLLVALKHQGLKLDLVGSALPGGKLVAILRAPGVSGVRQLGATLTCKNVVDAAWRFTPMNDDRYQEEVLATQQASFPVVARDGGIECRIEFALPKDAPRTSAKVWLDRARSTGILWELSVHARGASGELKQEFLVPVGKMDA